MEHYGQYLRIWNPDIEYHPNPYLMTVSNYQWVANCNPVAPPTNTPVPMVPLSLNFWATTQQSWRDSVPLYIGQ